MFDTTVTARLSPGMRDELERLARCEARSTSNLVRLLLTDALRRRADANNADQRASA